MNLKAPFCAVACLASPALADHSGPSGVAGVGRQEVDGETEPDGGGKAVWLGPGARFNSAGGLTVGRLF